VKTVRFSKVVEASGKPEAHLIFTDPKIDKDLQAAIKAERVMTVFQGAVGNATDRGEIGFVSGNSRQFLLFPKSLKKFKGRSVVGIKYELIHAPDVPKSDQAALGRAPRKEKVRKQRNTKAPKKKPNRSHEKHSKAQAARTASNVLPFTAVREEEGKEEATEIKTLKNQVRRAMKSLAQGKQVAAFNLLKEIVDG
jgi:hypothetical protein